MLNSPAIKSPYGDGKGSNDRVTILPKSVKQSLLDHLTAVRKLHQKDLAEEYERVQMPYALARKYPNAATEWSWQFVFPQEKRWVNKQTGEQGRHHVHEIIMQRTVREAIRKAGINKQTSKLSCASAFLCHPPFARRV